MPGTLQYSLYGLRVRSNIELPGVILAREAANARESSIVTIDCRRELNCSVERSSMVFDGNAAIVAVSGVGEFTVREGSSIVVQPDPKCENSVLLSYLLGMILGILLHQRDLLALHASCVALGEDAILVCGASGAGKSTFAAGLLSAGAKLLADDITAVIHDSGRPVVQPAFPLIKLSDSVADLALGYDAKSCTAYATKEGKRAYIANRCFESEPRELKAIYLLDSGARATIERVRGRSALIQCIPNIFVQFGEASRNIAPLLKLHKLLRDIPVFNFARKREIMNLRQDCELLREHFSGLLSISSQS